MRYFFYIFWILILLVGFSFSALNPGKVTLNYYFATKTVYVSLALLISLVTGFMLGFIALIPGLIESKRTTKQWQKYFRKLEEDYKPSLHESS